MAYCPLHHGSYVGNPNCFLLPQGQTPGLSYTSCVSKKRWYFLIVIKRITFRIIKLHKNCFFSFTSPSFLRKQNDSKKGQVILPFSILYPFFPTQNIARKCEIRYPCVPNYRSPPSFSEHNQRKTLR